MGCIVTVRCYLHVCDGLACMHMHCEKVFVFEGQNSANAEAGSF